jgi:hypothetical protein
MPRICQATRTVPATVEIPSGSPDGPFYLCEAAAERLRTRSLAPREWYNLAVLFSPWVHELHDDFYDEDGTADQPDLPVPSYGDERDRVPTLAEVASNLAELIDYLQTRWRIDEDHKAAIRAHPPRLVLSIATARHAKTLNTSLRAVLEEVLAIGARELSLPWFRARIAETKADLRLSIIASAAEVLPAGESFELATSELQLFPAESRHHHLYCLHILRNLNTPAWIERNVCPPVVNDWGRLAAMCNVDWTTTRRWLRSGRPLSLVALDSIIERVPRQPDRPSRAPKLQVPSGPSELSAALDNHLHSDPSVRVRQLTAFALKHLGDIVA